MTNICIKILLRLSLTYTVILIGAVKSNAAILIDTIKSPKNVVYIEVNHHNLKNAGGYTFAGTGKPFFDIAIIFAANINYSIAKHKAVLYCNPNVRAVLNRKKDHVTSLQKKGIKVLLAILGNHHGVGVTNFKTREAAADFAQQVADTIKNNNLDGVDIDDEWVDYKPDLPRNSNSLIWLLSELRKLMPGKIISLYDMDIMPEMKASKESKVSDYINYSWQPYYGKFNPPVYPGLGKDKISPGAIDVTQAKVDIYIDFARKTKAGGYGWMMYYNLTPKDISAELSAAANLLYGATVKASSESNQPWTNLVDTDPDWEKVSGIR
ncbi:MAG: chitinase [Sphingobacteriales bacterium]|nr:MAG: chitinase [Sphingobacteriales bacterium]